MVHQTGLHIPKGGVFDKADAVATLPYDDGQARLDVLGIQRLSKDKVIARFRLRGDSPGSFTYGDQDHLIYDRWDLSFDSVWLLDLRGRQLYVPMMRDDGTCACTGFYLSTDTSGGPGATLWAVYPVPRGTGAVTVMEPDLGVTHEVPIAPKDAPVPELPGEPDPRQLSKATGAHYPLSAATLGDNRRVKEKGRKVTVELAADVLFRFGKANLTDEATKQLRRAAKRLRNEAAGKVSITGYTDAIGSKRDNLKLSKKRAEVVADALRPLVRGHGLRFIVSGKGEADPVAPNRVNGKDNPEGRRLNRRVEISYQRRTQPATPTPRPSQEHKDRAHTRTLGAISGSDKATEGIVIHLRGVRRMPGGTALIRFAATNESSESLELDQYRTLVDTAGTGWVGYYHGGEVFWVRLEGRNNSAYLPLSDSSSTCLCSQTIPLDPGASTELWVMTTAPPKGVRKIDVTFVNYGTIKNVPLRG